jgi:exo-1,4-beta-D-glucosaminidase
LKKIDLNISKETTWEGDEGVIKVTIRNPADKLSFFNRLMVTKGEGGDEVWPSFWSDNFITLMPGEEKTVVVRFAKKDLDGKEPVLVLDKDI